MNPRAILRAFADLSAPDSEPERRTDVINDPRLITPAGHIVEKLYDGGKVSDWSLQRYKHPPQTGRMLENTYLDPSKVDAFGNASREIFGKTGGMGVIDWPDNDAQVLSADALHSGERRMRVGWIWFAGTVSIDEKRTRFCFPAISVPVERSGASREIDAFRKASNFWNFRPLNSYTLEAVGDVEATDLITDPGLRERLLAGRDFGSGALGPARYGYDVRMVERLDRMNGWIDDVAKAVGIKIEHRRVIQDGLPTDFRSKAGISMIVGNYLYIEQPNQYHTTARRLTELAGLPGLGATAFAKIYGEDTSHEPGTGLVHELRPMSARQRIVVSNALSEDVGALSGPPGTGKSHLITVAALDAMARGKSVLVAASSHHAVNVLIQHFSDTPGPTPVVFGGSARSQDLADELAARGYEAASDADRADIETPAKVEHERLVEEISRSLLAESIAERLRSDPTERSRADITLERAGDLDELESLIEAGERSGPLGWVVRQRNEKDLERRLGSGDPNQQLREFRALSAARNQLFGNGLSLDDRLNALADIEAEAAEQRGELITRAWLESLGRNERSTLRDIATAMSSSRALRRELLRNMNPAQMVRSAPLWVGSVEDIDEVLPAVAAMFDLVILDEAAQIDQMDAASALVRGRQAMVCGDPNQLGHTSFLSADRVDDVATSHKLDVSLIDPRRDSILDAAASVVPAHVLDQHFRSVPHLIEFSARRVYESSLNIVTRHPSNEAADHIDVRIVDGERNDQKVNVAEVAESLKVASEMIEQGHTSIGFMSPFRAQADAIEEAVLKGFSLREIDRYGLRVGTVHSFQGDERDVTIASWAVGPDESLKAWQFVNQQQLFNVMVTRAREHMVVVTSVEKPPGLAGEYLRWSEPLTDLVTDVPSADPWVQMVEAALIGEGVPVRSGYRVGSHVIDLVAGAGEDAVAIDCVPHEAGQGAHIDRALQLRRMGWKTADCYESKWHDQLAQFASAELKI